MEARKVLVGEEAALLAIREDHFNDVKSKLIAPAKLQETFVAFANSDGGDLFIGIEDPSHTGERISGFLDQESANSAISLLLEETTPAVENVSWEFIEIEGKGLVLHFSIPKSPKVHYTSGGDCYIRVNAQKKKIKGERITQLGYSKGAEPFEIKTVPNCDLQDILDNDALQIYMKRINSHLEQKVFLKKQRLLSLKDGEYIPNVGCVLLFDANPQATLGTRCAVKVYRLRTTESEYKREQLEEMPVTIGGGVEEVITKTIKKVAEYVDGASFMDGEKLIKLRYPAEALKEILVNAVIHRDYSLNDDIHVKIFDNRIEIQSPGKLPGYISIDNIYDERFSRNPNLVRMLHNLPNPVNHDIGEGLDTAKNELKKAGLVDPMFTEKDNAFIVTVRHQRIASLEDVILDYISQNPNAELTNKLVRQLSGEDDMQKVKLAVQKLRASGDIKPVDGKATAFNFKYVKA